MQAMFDLIIVAVESRFRYLEKTQSSHGKNRHFVQRIEEKRNFVTTFERKLYDSPIFRSTHHKITIQV